MKKIYKALAVITAALIACFAFAACGDNTADTGSAASQDSKYKIGIIQYVSHPSLDNCYNGVVEALKADPTIEIERQIGSDASPDSDCAAYAQNMIKSGCDMIIAIATPAATSAFAAADGTDVPVIFCAVSDPEKAEIVESNDAPGYNCTGTSDVLDLSAQLDLIQAMQPDVKSVGILYTASEANSISNLEVMKKIADERGINIDAVSVNNAADIPSAATALAARVDCLNNFTDNNVVNNLSVVVEAATNAGIPVYGSEVEQVKNGCLAAVSIDYVALGKVTGNMALDVKGGASAATMAVKTISDATPVVNTDVLAKLNIKMPAAYANAETVTTNS